MPLRASLAAGLAIFIWACGSGSGDAGPLSPTAPAPAGCTGSPISQVQINFNVPGTVQVFGETFEILEASGQTPFRITRNVVPCEYVMTGQLRNQVRLIIGFGKTEPFKDSGGVVKGSIIVEQGNGTFTNECVLSTGGPSAPEYRIRFRVGPSNGC